MSIRKLMENNIEKYLHLPQAFCLASLRNYCEAIKIYNLNPAYVFTHFKNNG